MAKKCTTRALTVWLTMHSTCHSGSSARSQSAIGRMPSGSPMPSWRCLPSRRQKRRHDTPYSETLVSLGDSASSDLKGYRTGTAKSVSGKSSLRSASFPGRHALDYPSASVVGLILGLSSAFPAVLQDSQHGQRHPRSSAHRTLGRRSELGPSDRLSNRDQSGRAEARTL